MGLSVAYSKNKNYFTLLYDQKQKKTCKFNSYFMWNFLAYYYDEYTQIHTIDHVWILWASYAYNKTFFMSFLTFE